MTIGQRVGQKRKELGLSQEALGEQLGVSRQSIYKWESDSALPEIDKPPCPRPSAAAGPLCWPALCCSLPSSTSFRS